MDFNESFASIVRIESIRIIFAIAAANDLYILHVDCQNAFRHGKSDVEIYVTQSKGFIDDSLTKSYVSIKVYSKQIHASTFAKILFLKSTSMILKKTDVTLFFKSWKSMLISNSKLLFKAFLELTSFAIGINISLHLIKVPISTSRARLWKSLLLLNATPGEKMCNLEYYQRLTGSLIIL